MAKKQTKKSNGKKNVLKVVEKMNRGPLKSRSTDKKVSWLESYIADPQKSGAKLITAKLSKGCSIDELITVAKAYNKKAGSKWGQTPSSVKAHFRFLQSKGCVVTEKDGVFRVSQ